MTQTEEARNSGNVIRTNMEPLVDMGLSNLLSNILDVPLYFLSAAFAFSCISLLLCIFPFFFPQIPS